MLDRLKRHNAGHALATSKGVPWVVLWCGSKPSKAEAMSLEKKLKNLSRDSTVAFMLKYNTEVPSSVAMKFLLHWSER